MNINKVIQYFLFVTSLFFIPAEVQSTELDLQFDSKYVSEGRDNLDTGGIFWLNATHEMNDHLSLLISYGEASSSTLDYDELNVTIEYASSYEQWEYYLGYTRLEFFEDSESDNEITAGLAWTGSDLFTPYIDYIYGHEVRGSYFSFGITREFIVSDDITLAPYAVIDYDFGYISEEYDGHNHSAVGLNITIQADDGMGVSIVAEHNIAGEDVKRDLYPETETWFGLHFIMNF